MLQVHSLELPELERFLERQKAALGLRSEIGLDVLLRQILLRAYEFVPSESGSILLDDPFLKVPTKDQNDLVFIAAFGQASSDLIGRRFSASHGIAGRVYQTGHPYLSADVHQDAYFFAEIDEKVGHQTQSVVCVPIYIGKSVCGVLELVNRGDGKPFTDRDMTLLEIFAGYTSFTLQNALDAKRAQELAKRDDLTGLYNDRWFHVRLHELVLETADSGREFVLLFMDLDNFKAVNDRYGHLAGSQVLREVAFLLKRVITVPDSVVSRYGGDEFVMILPDTPLVEGSRIAERIRAAVEETTFLQREYGFGLPAVHLRGLISASIGIAAFVPRSGERKIEAEKEQLLKRADGAMYQAKSEGKNRIVVSDRAPEELGIA
ncbi:MAG TPA: sensor domain-containing diguanylate cyclase [Thermoanaerobaculia bacterium]|nr:sensor domain-containing diguanylate cyclase [Thermoanaerobaculia bacterium]